uniref:Uncharacterized protein n=1 Tax=Laticauda laticaudata TaxID=8630 RepID=A0A8C5SA75_LATLA
MDPWKNWTRCSLLWVFCCYYLFLLTVASPLPLNQTGTLNNQSCSLSRHHFRKFAFKNMTYTVAREVKPDGFAQCQSWVIGPFYWRNEHCYLMKRVTNTVTHVLHDLKNPNPNFHEVIYFFAHLTAELLSRALYKNHHQIKFYAKQCVLRSVEDHTFAMIFQLGDNGMNKMVGELDLLYDYLRDACTSKKAIRGHQSKKNNG